MATSHCVSINLCSVFITFSTQCAPDSSSSSCSSFSILGTNENMLEPDFLLPVWCCFLPLLLSFPVSLHTCSSSHYFSLQEPVCCCCRPALSGIISSSQKKIKCKTQNVGKGDTKRNMAQFILIIVHYNGAAGLRCALRLFSFPCLHSPNPPQPEPDF